MSPACRAARNTATAHSAVMSGSLYVLTMLVAPWRSASLTSCSGEVTSKSSVERKSRNACELTQFWQ